MIKRKMFQEAHLLHYLQLLSLIPQESTGNNFWDNQQRVIRRIPKWKHKWDFQSQTEWQWLQKKNEVSQVRLMVLLDKSVTRDVSFDIIVSQ